MMRRQARKQLFCTCTVLAGVFLVVLYFNLSSPPSLKTIRLEARNSNYTYEQAWKIFRNALNRYKDHHKRGIKALQSSERNNVKTLTWACSRKTCNCGLGDQLLKIQFFFLLALMSDRVFAVTWDADLRHKTGDIEHNQINWDVFNSSLGMCSHESDPLCSHNVYASTSFFGFGWTESEYERFGEALFGQEKHITVTANVFVSAMFISDISLMRAGKMIEEGFQTLGVSSILEEDRYKGVHFTHGSPWYAMLQAVGLTKVLGILPMNNGHVLASESWVHLNHVVFNYLFKFSAGLTTRVEEIKKSLEIDRQSYVAVHLRTGFEGSPHVDSLGTRLLFRNWKFFDQSAWTCILAYSIQVADNLIGPYTPVYVATDSLTAKEWAKTKYGARIRTAALNPAHFAHASEIQDGKSLWIDFHILGGAQIMIRGDSSYATNAAFLAPIPLSRQAWIWRDDNMKCIVSHLGSNTTCIC